MMKNKKFIVFVAIVLFLLGGYFIFPNPNAYLLEETMNDSTTNHYSFYQTQIIQKEIEKCTISQGNPHFLYHQKTAVFGKHVALIINHQEYCFYKAYEDEQILMTVQNVQNRSWLGYTLLSYDEYQTLNSKIQYCQFDNLSTW